MSATLKTLLALSLFAAMVFLFLKCPSGCKLAGGNGSPDTVYIEIEGEMMNETPQPTEAHPPVDSSIFERAEYYQKKYEQYKAKYSGTLADMSELESILQDSTKTSLERMEAMNRAYQKSKAALLEAETYVAGVNLKLQEAAKGDYLVEGKDSTENYILTYSIRSKGPLYTNGFVRKVDTNSRQITGPPKNHKNTIGALAGYNEMQSPVFGVQFGRNGDGKVSRFAVIGQYQFSKDKPFEALLAGLQFKF